MAKVSAIEVVEIVPAAEIDAAKIAEKEGGEPEN